MQSRILMVVGMHRSGTSLTSNWLYRCGLQLGESLLTANTGNKEGYFEDHEFLRMHEEILDCNALNPTGLVYDKQIDIPIYQLEKLKSVIKIKKQRYDQWGWKEPRTCLFLDLYRELLPDAKYLVITRDYLSVVTSLLKREFGFFEKKYLSRSFLPRMIWILFRSRIRKRKFYKTNAEEYLKVWIDYSEHILSTLKDLPPEDYIVINYALLETCDKKIFSFLTDQWNFKLNYFPFNDVYKKDLIGDAVDLSPFLKDAGLLSKAKKIEETFQEFIVTG